jgi:2'-5' RNA ligase
MRTFIAFDITEDSKNIILNIQDNYRKTASGKVTYTKPAQFHLTVFFLGEIGEKGAKRIIEILKKYEISEPLTLRFDKVSYFPTEKHPRVIVLKTEAGTYLTEFVKKLDHEIIKLGFKRDKKWVPHITLGRIRDSFSAGEFTILPFTADIAALTFYKSALTPGGSHYEKLFEVKLPVNRK